MRTTWGVALGAIVFCSFNAAGCGDNLRSSTDGTGVLVITAAGGPETTEAGGTATFEVALNRPADLTVKLASSNLFEGVVSPLTLTFDRNNWETPQRVTVTGVDDDVSDGDQIYSIQVDAGELGEGEYPLANRDDDVVGVTVTPQTGAQTTEDGDTVKYDVRLTSEPTGNVTIPVDSTRTAEGALTMTSLTFSPTNWNANQVITVTGVDDAIADGDQTYQVTLGAAISSDPKYNSFDPADIALTNLDNDIANILVTPTGGLQTSEGATTATFSVRLLSQPTADVTFTLASDDLTEGTASPASVTFTTVNWNAPRTITVTGVNDDLADSAITYHVVLDPATSADVNYAAKNPEDVTLVNLDNDTAGVLVTANAGLTTTESLGTAEFGVTLLSQPTADVTIAVATGDDTEGVPSTTLLTFTSVNWNAPQTVTVTGVDDNLDDGNQTYAVVLSPAVSGDAGYVGQNPDDVSLTNLDNDTAGIQVSRDAGLITDESGLSDTFTVVLLSEPTQDVTIPFASDDTTEGTVLPASPLVFTPLNWNVPQTVTVVGVDDTIRDFNQPYNIVVGPASSTDPTYNNLVVGTGTVAAVNNDNDTAQIIITPLSLFVSEFPNDTDFFEISLSTQPLTDVTIPLSSSDEGEGTLPVGMTSVTFTPLNWNIPQIVTVTGVDDSLVDGFQIFYILTGPALGDLEYLGLDADDVEVSNFDDESPGVYVQARGLLRTQEDSNQPAFIRMRLTIQPTSDVVCVLESSDTSEVTVTPTTFTFTPQNFDMMQTVTVRGVNDDLLDGDQEILITTFACTSLDPVYSGFNPRNVRVLNRDDDT